MINSRASCLCGLVPALAAGAPTFQELPAQIESTGVRLAGTWLFPDDHAAVPCVIIAGGTMSYTRDGALLGRGPAGEQRDALRRLAVRLAAAGYGSLRWDKRGQGKSPPGPQPVTNEMEADDVAAAIRLARANVRVTKAVVAGESAGGYFACMAAANGTEGDGYIFLGCLASSSRRLFAYNYGRLAAWADRSEQHLAWAKANALEALALGHGFEAMFDAAARGEREYTIEYDGRKFPRSLVRITTEMRHKPAEMFQHIRRPALVLQGEADMNVPPGDADTITDVLRQTGNADVTKVIIPNADHSFQFASGDEDQRIRDRHGFGSFYRLYSPQLYSAIAEWLRRRFPSEVPQGRAHRLRGALLRASLHPRLQERPVRVE